MNKKNRPYKVVVINPLILALLPQLIVHYVNKRNLAFSFNRDNVIGLLGVTFIGIWLVSSILLLKYIGLLSYVLFFFLIGSMGLTMLINAYLVGLVFIRKDCDKCKFRKLIIDHEIIHLNSNSTEKEVWNSLKKVYTAEKMNVYEDRWVCDYCPIPAHLIEE